MLLHHDRGPFPDGRSHPLHRAAADVADGEDACDADLDPKTLYPEAAMAALDSER